MWNTLHYTLLFAFFFLSHIFYNLWEWKERYGNYLVCKREQKTQNKEKILFSIIGLFLKLSGVTLSLALYDQEGYY